jgi:hypothetical protein
VRNSASEVSPNWERIVPAWTRRVSGRYLRVAGFAPDGFKAVTLESDDLESDDLESDDFESDDFEPDDFESDDMGASFAQQKTRPEHVRRVHASPAF